MNKDEYLCEYCDMVHIKGQHHHEGYKLDGEKK